MIALCFYQKWYTCGFYFADERDCSEAIAAGVYLARYCGEHPHPLGVGFECKALLPIPAQRCEFVDVRLEVVVPIYLVVEEVCLGQNLPG